MACLPVYLRHDSNKADNHSVTEVKNFSSITSSACFGKHHAPSRDEYILFFPQHAQPKKLLVQAVLCVHHRSKQPAPLACVVGGRALNASILTTFCAANVSLTIRRVSVRVDVTVTTLKFLRFDAGSCNSTTPHHSLSRLSLEKRHPLVPMKSALEIMLLACGATAFVAPGFMQGQRTIPKCVQKRQLSSRSSRRKLLGDENMVSQTGFDLVTVL